MEHRGARKEDYGFGGGVGLRDRLDRQGLQVSGADLGVAVGGIGCGWVYPGYLTSEAPHDGADHMRVKQPGVNRGEPRMNTNRHEYPWTCLAATPSWDEGPLGARASRPHNTGTAPPISSTRLDRQRRQDSASAGPRRFPPTGWPGAISQGNRAVPKDSACGRDARVPRGRLLRVSSWITLSSFVSGKGAVVLRQTTPRRRPGACGKPRSGDSRQPWA